MDPILHAPGAGDTLPVGNGAEVTIKVGGDGTAGTFFMGETTFPANTPGPPLHRHRELHDMFYVLDGTLTIVLEDGEQEAGPGSFACFPPGVAHTFANRSDAPVRFLNFNTPAGWERYMRDLADAARSGPLTPERLGPIAANYDIQLA